MFSTYSLFFVSTYSFSGRKEKFSFEFEGSEGKGKPACFKLHFKNVSLLSSCAPAGIYWSVADQCRKCLCNPFPHPSIISPPCPSLHQAVYSSLGHVGLSWIYVHAVCGEFLKADEHGVQQLERLRYGSLQICAVPVVLLLLAP